MAAINISPGLTVSQRLLRPEEYPFFKKKESPAAEATLSGTILHVDASTKPLFFLEGEDGESAPLSNSYTVLEGEVSGEFTGSMAVLFDAGTGHQPAMLAAPIDQITDSIYFNIDLAALKAYADGHDGNMDGCASWKIPITLVDTSTPDQLPLSCEMIQKYEISGETLSVSKADSLLYSLDLIEEYPQIFT